LAGYEIGAEEYIPKPFHLKELLLRVQHVLEKHSPLFEVQISNTAWIDFSGRRLLKKNKGEADQFEKLNQKEYGILRLLFEASPNVVSRDDILNQVWGEDEFPTNRTVDNIVVRLRQLLGDAGDCIHSVRGIGYQWLKQKKD